MNADGIAYRPEYNAYIIRVGGRTVEADAWALKQARNTDQIESILRNGTDAEKRNLSDSIMRLGGRLGSANDPRDDGYAGNRDPIDALYRGAMDPRDAAIACAETPKPTPDCDPKAMPKIYYDDRFPSKRSVDIIDEAIELPNSKKNIGMAEISIEPVFEGFRLRAHSDTPAVGGTDKTLIALIKRTAFDRAHKTDIDDSARLMAKPDADAYIKLRIAFLLYEALKTCEYDKQLMDSDIFEILYSD